MDLDRLHVRPLADDELAMFAAIGADPAAASRVEAFVREVTALGETRPDWCFVALDGDTPVARVAYLGLNVEAGDFVISCLALPWGPDAVAVGDVLLTRSRAMMAGVVDTLGLAVWQDDAHAADKTALMAALGWPLAQDRRRFEATAVAGPVRLRYRSAAEVGPEAFVAAIAEVTRGTLDAALAADVERLGLEPAARRHWEDLIHQDDRRDAFELAYDADDRLAGLIVPQAYGSMGVIGYIGVVPAQRGRGHVRDLLLRGLATLAAVEPPVTRVVADIDAANHPMAQALAATGFRQTRSERRYRAPAASSSAVK